MKKKGENKLCNVPKNMRNRKTQLSVSWEKKTGWEEKRIGGEGLVMKTTEDFFSFKYK